MVRTLKSFAVVPCGSRGFAQALLTPVYLTLLLCASGLGQDHTIHAVVDNPLANSVRPTQTAGVAADSATLSLAGSLAQIASGGGWDTSLTLVNLGTAAGQASLSFYANNGSALSLPYTFPQQPAVGTTTGSTINENLNANAVLVLDTTGPVNQAAAIGSSQLLTSGNIAGFGIFTYTPSGQAAVVPLEVRNALSYVLAFDNTGNLATGLAIANLASGPASVGVVIRDDTGQQIGTGTINLAPQGHSSFMLTDSASGFPITAGKRGTVEFDTPEGGQISVLGLRVNGNALTSLPVLANVGTAGGTMAHVASGGGWQTLFTLVNTGATSANVTLNFSADDGTALSLPLSFPQQTGMTATESSVSQVIPAGATLLIATQGLSSASAVTGSAQLTTTGNVSGFAIFQNGGQEAVVPLQAGTASSYTLAFDNTGNLVTGVALANSSGQAAVVPATLRDSTGATLASTTVNLPASGHSSQILTNLFAQAQNIRGTLEFDTPAGGQIGALGIRASGTAFTTIPVMTTAVTGDVVAERELAQTGLAVGLASTVLQSQLAILDTTLTDDLSCVALNGGGSVLASPSKGTVTVYYGTDCTQPYLVSNLTGSLGTSGGAQINILETATYYGLSGTNIGTLSLNETALVNGGAIDVYGLGAFTPASGAQTPVQLGLYCEFGSATAKTALCAGGVAQDFPELGLAIGAVTPLTVTLSSPPPILQVGAASSGGVTFTGGGTAFTGPIGSLKLTNPEPAALNLTGGTRYAFTTASGSAAAFSLFPPTPTSWTLTDSAHDQQLQISVVSNTARNLTLTITQTSTGSTLATGALDHSGSGTITYSDGSVAVITNWTLAD